MQRAWNQAHAEGVRKQKEEGKKETAEKARRKEERDKRRRLQQQAREEEESSSTDDDDDDEEEVDQYDWLDSMAEERELPRESSLPTEGQSPRAKPPHRESGGPSLGVP
jgi:hypothetical protein